MAVILSMKGLLDCYQPGDRCRLCDGELAPPFLAWCGPCCRQIKRGLSSDLVHVAAIVELQMLGYPATTLDRRSVEEVDYEERSRWTRLSDNVVSLIPPRDPDPDGPSTGLPTLTINLKGSQQLRSTPPHARGEEEICAQNCLRASKSLPICRNRNRARRAYRLRLPGGRSVFTWATPSDRRAMRNTKAQVRRVLKTPPLR